MAEVEVGVGLLGVRVVLGRIKIPDVLRRFRRDGHAGPYLITGLASDLALDTGKQGQGHPVASGEPDPLLPYQLWHLRPSGVRDEVLIISAANDLAMDATRATSDRTVPVMSKRNGQPWQHWRLRPSPDGNGFLIQSPRTGNCLTLIEDAGKHLDNPWAPWLSPMVGTPDQQWSISLPDGSVWGGPGRSVTLRDAG